MSSLDELFLKNSGGFVLNSLCNNISLTPEDNLEEDCNQPTLLKHSPYYEMNDKLISTLLSKKNCFTVLCSNLDSIYQKHADIEIFTQHLEEQGFHFSAICLQECRISNDSDLSTIQLKHYNCISQGKKVSEKGGLIIYLHEDFVYEKLDFLYSTSEIWEGQFIKINGGGLTKKITLGNLYRPPRDILQNYADFNEEMENLLTNLDKTSSDVMLTGDFNINLLEITTRPMVSAFYDIMCSHSFYPKITLPTRFSNTKGTLIDNIFCKLSPSMLDTTSGILTGKWSDHQPYFTCLNTITKNEPPPKFIKIKIETPEAITHFQNELNNSNILDKLDRNPTADPTQNLTLFDSILQDAKDKHFPCKTVRFHKHKHKRNSWITQGIIMSIKFRDRLYKRLRSTPINDPMYSTLKTNLSTYNSILKRNIRTAKKLFYEKLFKKYEHDIKNTWSTINEILSKTKKKKQFPEYFLHDNIKIHDKLQIANQFNLFFTNIGPELANKIKSKTNFKSFMKRRHTCELKFKNIGKSDVIKIIDKLKPKSSCGYDGISSKLLKQIKNEIAEPLALIINQSLNTGIFPDQLKLAKVIPLYKKDAETIFTNYRPISLLPAISKIFEKVIYNQLYEYFQTYKLFYVSQYGFREGHSTEYASLELIDRILTEMDSGKIPICVFLDLSKAFDTLDHDILSHKLNYYGVKGNASKLLNDYLTGRNQYVDFDGTESSTLPISTGVPQGSILGPLLFIIYMNDIAEITSLFNMIMYADDTSLQSTLNYFDFNTKNNIDNKINAELNQISEWLKSNKLSLNVSKSKFMVFHQTKKNFRIPQLSIENSLIEHVESFNFLGLTIDKQLNWKKHIDKVYGKISRAIGILNRLKNFIPLHIKLTIYNSLILSHINYCILAWGSNLNRIEKQQKKAIRIITCSKYNAHTEPLLKTLNLLKATDIFTLAKLKFYHRFVNNQHPSYLQNLPLQSNTSVHNYNTRNSNNIHRNRISHTFAKQSTRFDIPITINKFPDLIKDKFSTHSLGGFAQYTKKYLISKYSNACEIRNCYICNNQS